MAKNEERWETRTFTMRLDVGTYGQDVDDEELAYILRMGGIDAEPLEAARRWPNTGNCSDARKGQNRSEPLAATPGDGSAPGC